MSKQPVYKFVANLGDASPLEYGGYFVYVDETGVYPPQAEWLELDDPDEEDTSYTVYRFYLEPYTYINGVLSDNRFHPEMPAWFANTEEERKKRPQDSTYLAYVASYTGIAEPELIKMFCSADPCERARAWEAVGSYHGWENLDSYPLKLTRIEAEERYKEILK